MKITITDKGVFIQREESEAITINTAGSPSIDLDELIDESAERVAEELLDEFDESQSENNLTYDDEFEDDELDEIESTLIRVANESVEPQRRSVNPEDSLANAVNNLNFD